MDLILLEIVTWTRTGIRRCKCATQVVTDMMKIGENPRKNGFLMMSTRRIRSRNINKKEEVFTKRRSMRKKEPSLEEMLTKFVAASEKRHNDHDAAIQEASTMLRNQQASIHNIETQLGQLAQQINQ